MAKFPYLTGRRGTNNLYYKREVPLELRADGTAGSGLAFAKDFRPEEG